MKKIILTLLMIMLLNIPVLVFAAVPKGDFKVPDGDFGVTVPKGTSGTFAAKTSGGSAKYIPTEGGGKYYLASIRLRVKGELSDKVYLTVTFGDGYKLKIASSLDGAPVDVGTIAFKAHKSKGISVSLHSDGSAEKYVKLVEYGFLSDQPDQGGGGTTNPAKAVEGEQRLHRRVAAEALGAVVPAVEVLPTHRVVAVTIPAGETMAVPPIQGRMAAVLRPAVTHART
jgi:hypothetical protein